MLLIAESLRTLRLCVSALKKELPSMANCATTKEMRVKCWSKSNQHPILQQFTLSSYFPSPVK
jgi:hypothetical protein